MSRPPRIPPDLTDTPFRGSHAVAGGLISRRMLAGPAWQRLLPDVYAHRDTVLDHPAWCRAAMLILPASAAIGGLSAASLWSSTAPAAAGEVHVVAPRHYRSHLGRRIVVHHTSLAPGDVTTFGALRMTTPERTIFDVARRAARSDALAVLDALLHRHLLDLEVLSRMAAERSEWPRAGRLAGLLRLAEPRSESPMETRLRLLLLDAGVPVATAQFEVRDLAGALLGRVDLAWPALRLAVEYDGDQHRDPQQFRDDVARLNALRLAGWTVLRFTADDVLRRRGETARTVLAAMTQLSGRASHRRT